MKKLIKNSIKVAVIVFSVLSTTSSFAEFEVSPNIKVSGEKKMLSASELPLPSQSKPAVRKKLASATKRNKTKEFAVNKKQLFRCWQYGELIVAENGFTNPGPAGQKVLSKGGEVITGFDFGETFCLYMGN